MVLFNFKIKMETDRIVPEIIEEIPPKQIQIMYLPPNELKLGQLLTPLEVKCAPKISFEASPDQFYTLLMTDPDAPSKKYPFLGPINHWLVANMKGGDFSTGEVIIEYVGAGPPKYTGLHR